MFNVIEKFKHIRFNTIFIIKFVTISIFSFIVILWVSQSCIQRIKKERDNRILEICIDWDELLHICQINRYPLSNFLERCKAIGVSSIAINEQTFNSLIEDGDILYFSEQDYKKLVLLDLLPPVTLINPNSILIKDTDTASTLLFQMTNRYGFSVEQKKVGKYLLFYIKSLISFSLLKEDLPLGFSNKVIKFISDYDFNIVLKPSNIGNPEWLFQNLPKNLSCLLFDNKEIIGFGGNELYLSRKIKEYGIYYTFLEFVNVSGSNYLLRFAPENFIRGHTIPVSELYKNLDSSLWIPRWKRCVRERSIRFLYIHLYNQKNIEQNLDYLRSVIHNLKKYGFIHGKAYPPQYPFRGNHVLWIYIVFIIAVMSPLIAIKAGLEVKLNPSKKYFITNLFSLIGGLIISSSLFDYFFMNKIIEIPNIKLSLILPFLFMPIIIYPPFMIKHFLTSKLKIKDILLFLFIIIIIGLLIIRSGNQSLHWLKPEQEIRDIFERLFIVRPRTKEFLFAQPLLYLGLKYKNRLLIWLGSIGQISIINTFMHAHTPLIISISRSIEGIIIGFIIGIIVSGILSILLKRINFIDNKKENYNI